MPSLLLPRRVIYLLIPIWLAMACHVMLIGAYDQVTDESIQRIQTHTMTMLVKLERNFDNHHAEENRYELFKTDYENLAGESESLLIRCKAIPKYAIVIEQVTLLEKNLSDLEKYHQNGINSKAELAPIKQAFESQFGAMIVLQNSLKRKKTD
jgi:hypothetical protein